ncbi:hypothetical protein GQ602_007047 [Ophiocordyceps camponoti-floridani]|uniref:Uncharacterized protein n=1 Tax=Ophiocordyceps camponoti-floridani TaxID=2030778 RepID=A0A8H4VAN8_9HYPO|nr:hypothetical protein GQ602_007047 [Ophiocordyceps camponoti-floridani]
MKASAAVRQRRERIALRELPSNISVGGEEMVRIQGSEPEDVWFSERLRHAPDSKMANGTISTSFSAEMHPPASKTKTHLHPPRISSGVITATPKTALIAGLDDWRAGGYATRRRWMHGAVWGHWKGPWGI